MSSLRPMTAVERHLEWTSLAGSPGPGVDVNRHVLRETIVPHDHDFVEATLVESGRAVHVTLYGSRRVGPGDAWVIRPGAWHTLEVTEELRVVNCCFSTRLLERELSWLAEEPRLAFVLWPPLGDGVLHLNLPARAREECGAYLRAMEASGSAGERAGAIAYLVLLLCALARHLEPERARELERLASAHGAAVRAMRLLAEDLARPWRVEELAAAVALSPAYLTRLFTRTLGVSPMAHLNRLRAEAAATTLLRTGDSVTEIGAAVGWPDPNYFARRFRAHFSLSPSAYRRRRRPRAPAGRPRA